MCMSCCSFSHQTFVAYALSSVAFPLLSLLLLGTYKNKTGGIVLARSQSHRAGQLLDLCWTAVKRHTEDKLVVSLV